MRSSVGVSALLICVIAIGDLYLQEAAAAPPARKATRSIDCRRLVFHPQCRGVAAKRSSESAVGLPLLLEGLEGSYERDPDAAAASSPIQSGQMPPGLSALGVGVDYLPSDRLLQALLMRFYGRRGNGEGVNDIVAGDNGVAAAAVTGDSGKAEYGRVDWQPPQQQRVQRKRLEQPEVSFDY